MPLSFNSLKTRFLALDHWFTTYQGKHVAQFFSEELHHIEDILHGETLLQLGNCGANPWISSLHYSHKWQVSLSLNSSTTLMSSYNQLAIDRNSLDCIIAPLVLEAFTSESYPIDEIDRILKPMGHVVFLGINPLSLWGFYLRFSSSACFGKLKGHPKSEFSLQRAMSHRGYIQTYLSSFYYIPPVSTPKWLDKLEILNELGKMISPCPAGFYCLVMQKQQEIEPNLLLDDAKESWESKRLFQPTYQSPYE